MAADESSGSGDEDGDSTGAVDLSGVPDLLLPLDPSPGGGEVPATGIHEALEAQVGSSQGDQEERPEEHRAGGGEASVELAVRSVDLELPRSRRKQLLLQRRHLCFYVVVVLFLRRRRRGSGCGFGVWKTKI